MRTYVLGALLCVAPGLIQATRANEPATPVVAQSRVVLNIPALPLTEALEALSHQAGVQILHRDVAGREEPRTKEIKGSFSLKEALDRLLMDTGYRYELVNERTVRVWAAAKETAAEGKQSATDNPPLGVAQAARDGSNSSEGPVAKSASSTEGDEHGLQEVVVTGSHIRGADPAGSRLILIGEGDIKASGYATVQDVLNTVPQNFSGGLVTDPTAAASNANNGATVNLRGLGVDSTLVLVNGRRQPSGGLSGAFFDVSNIPTSAIDHVEILPDGASAIYGSDAVGGVINIILKNKFDGLQTQAHYGSMDHGPGEVRASQLGGLNWDTGNVVVGYQYYRREPLLRDDRAFASTNNFIPFGGSDFRTNQASPGNILCPSASFGCTPGQAAFAVPPGQGGAGLQASQLERGVTNYRSLSDPRYDLLPSQKMNSVFVSASESPWHALTISTDLGYSDRASTVNGLASSQNIVVPKANPFFVDPFGGQKSVTVAYDFINDLGPTTGNSSTRTLTGTFGLSGDLPGGWRINAYTTYGYESVSFQQLNLLNTAGLTAALSNPSPSSAFDPFGNGSGNSPAVLDSIRFTRNASLSSKVSDSTINTDGALLPLPSGDVKLAAGLDYRNERLVPQATNSPGQNTYAKASRSVGAAYAELAVPIVSELTSVAGIERLDFSVAGRYEHYDDFGSTTNPKLGITWKPTSFVAVKGSWGKSFKAPRLIDELASPSANPLNESFILSVVDPKSPTGKANALILMGGNPDLRPERATTWSAGLELTPVATRHFVVYADYFNIDYSDRIAAGGASPSTATLLQENIWPQVITRNPASALVTQICSQPNSFCFGLTPSVIIDARTSNLAAERTRGVDFGTQFALQVLRGSLSFRVDGTYIDNLVRQPTPVAPRIDLVNTTFNPPRLKGRGSITWARGALSVVVFGNYVNAYSDNLSVPVRPVPAWTTFDLHVGYSPSASTWLTKGLQLGVSAVNVFNRYPPFVNTQGAGYDSANANPYGRLISADISKAW